MRENRRWHLNDAQRLLVALMVCSSIFLTAMAWGMGSFVVLLVAIALVGSAGLGVFLLGLRYNSRPTGPGTAYVVTAPSPPVGKIVGRLEMVVLLDMPGAPAGRVKLRDSSVPTSKWPRTGDVLPADIDPRTRQVRIRWDRADPGQHRTNPMPDARGPEPMASAAPAASATPAQAPPVSYGNGAEVEHEYSPTPANPFLPVVEAEYEYSPTPAPNYVYDLTPSVLTDAGVVDPDLGQSSPTDQADDGGVLDYDPAMAGPLDGVEEVDENLAETIHIGPRPGLAQPRPPETRAAETDEATPSDDGSDKPEYPLPSRTAAIPSPRPAEPAPAEPPPATPAANPPGAAQPAMGGMLIVSDLDRSLAFYRDTLGFQVMDHAAGAAVVAYGAGRVLLRQVADMSPVDRRVSHLHIEVRDVDASYSELKAKGVEFVHRPRVMSRGDKLELWAATFRDPDGHAVALTQWRDRQDAAR